MSKCIAENANEQEACFFSEKSTGEIIKCMFRIEAIGNHCDCQKAQKFARDIANGKETDNDELDLEFDPELLHEEEELTIDDLIEPEELAMSCSTCKLHDKCHLSAKGTPSQMSELDKVKIASTCRTYQPMSEREIKKKALPF
jgi:hypothetical protein